MGVQWCRSMVLGFAAATCLGGLLAGCADPRSEPTAAEPEPSPSVTPVTSPTGTPTSTPVPSATGIPPAMTCDPGFGFPRPRRGCPDDEPATAWLVGYFADRATLEPFTTYANDDEGRAYAQAHGLEFPFPNDYFDAPVGAAYTLDLDPHSVCTGIILIGYREPLEDHVVECDELRAATARRPIPVAVWQDGARVVQVSELYRP